MKTKIRNSICGLLVIPLVLVCFGLLPAARAVLPPPPPDGGYPGSNTAEGTNALQSRTTGVWNTALGYQALFNDTIGNSNTATGFHALFNNINGVNNTATGVLTLFSNNGGSSNTASGNQSLYRNTTGIQNTGSGARSLLNGSTGNDNTAIGYEALVSNTASRNTAIGSGALRLNSVAPENVAIGYRASASLAGSNGFSVAVGYQALDIATGGQNTAVGDNALGNVTTGTLNTAIGDVAGNNVTTASDVVCIGAFASGENFSNRAYIPNIGQFGQGASAGTIEFVTVRLSDGKLGHSISSRRYKDDIKPMDKASELLYQLKPVTFRFKKTAENTSDNLDYGLIAEDVAEINPELAVRDGNGQIESVRYMAIYNMMLNEFLKEHRKVEELQATVVQQQKGMEVLAASLKEQASQIQRVSAQLELNKPAPRTVLSNQ